MSVDNLLDNLNLVSVATRNFNTVRIQGFFGKRKWTIIRHAAACPALLVDFIDAIRVCLQINLCHKYWLQTINLFIMTKYLITSVADFSPLNLIYLFKLYAQTLYKGKIISTLTPRAFTTVLPVNLRLYLCQSYPDSDWTNLCLFLLRFTFTNVPSNGKLEMIKVSTFLVTFQCK